MKLFWNLYKWVGFFCFVLTFLVFSFLGRLVVRSELRRRHFHMMTTHHFCRFFLLFGNVHIEVINPPPRDKTDLLVSNHLGLIDIIVLTSIRPSLFVTSLEMKNTPGLGLLTEMGASLYVNRKNRANIRNEMLQIRQTLQEGFNVVLFPEATSTNGEQVLPFKKTLLTAAAGTDISIRPAVINYRKVNGVPMSPQWRDYVCWYGDLSFLVALKNILSMKRLDVEVKYFDPLILRTEEDRAEVCAKAHALVSGAFTPIR